MKTLRTPPEIEAIDTATIRRGVAVEVAADIAGVTASKAVVPVPVEVARAVVADASAAATFVRHCCC